MKKGGLGNFPHKGLEWIGRSSQQQVEPEEVKVELEPLKSSQANAEEQVKPGILVEKIKPKPKGKSTNTAKDLRDGFTRATFIIRQSHIEHLKALSFVKKVSIKELVDKAMTNFLKDKQINALLIETLTNLQDRE
jgi:hypothetical protein